MREKKVMKEKALKDIMTNEEANNLRIQGLNLEIKNISKKTKLTRLNIIKLFCP